MEKKDEYIIGIIGVFLLMLIGTLIYCDIQMDNMNTMVLEYNKTINSALEIIDEQDFLIVYQSQQLENLTLEYIILEEKYTNEKQAKESFKTEAKQINKKYNTLKSQKGLVNPSYRQLTDFISRDKTNKLDWEDYFDCSEFSYTFLKNFAKKGFYGSTVELEFYESDETYSHLIVLINTTDRGLVYIEPQDDTTLKNIDIGDDYCTLVGWNCDWEIYKISSCFELKN